VIAQEGAFRGPFEVYEVTGPDVKAVNDFGSEPITTVKKADLAADGDVLTYSFPPHSFTMLKGRIER